jgi:outer membrane lipoprotein LolB
MAIRACVVVLGLLLLLSGCAQPPQSTPLTSSWPQRQQQLSALNTWQFRGHVVFKMPERKFSANVYWQQEQDSYQVMLFGPLGFNAVNLDGLPGKVHLNDGDGHVYEASSPEELMQKQLGWSLPISSLYYWVRGLPAPGPVTRVSYDVYHRINTLEQDGWQIHYEAYQRLQLFELPKEITFTQVKFYMHLTIEGDSWQVKS